MITIDKLKKNFGEKVAVDIEHYEINQGDMLGLVGNNGAGKTTLFRLMLDLLKADDGKVIINDIDVSRSEDWKSITGAFIDDGFLIDYLTPEEYFYFIGKMYGLKKEEVDERLIPFERFMSGEVIGHKKLIRNYSAGNKQKIGIISAMLHYPQLLILDEPFNFLDPSSQSIIKHLLKKYNEEHQATVIISRQLMKAKLKFIYLLVGLAAIFSSCRTSAPRLDYQALARASILLGVDVNLEDNHKLYLEAADWIGVPYRGGGDSKRGTDCSGLVYQVYRKVYRTQVPRNTEDLKKESDKVAKRNLREGDLVFFTSSRSKKKVAHVGIYLKNGKFIHSSTSKGVIVSNLNESYYTKHWISGGRIR